MKTLLLLRHAKTEPGADDAADHERALTDVGRKAATRIGRAMADQGDIPGLALCSTALRARQTWTIVAGTWGTEPPVELSPALYLAPVPSLLDAIAAAPLSTSALLLVGHNPGLQDLVLHLARAGALRKSVAGGFPTCALGRLKLDIAGWPEIRAARGRAELEAVLTPATLAG